MKIEIKKNNLTDLFKIFELAKKNSTSKIEIVNNNLIFSDFNDDIYKLLDYEKYFEVWLIDFPYCVINENSRDHIIFENQGVKAKKCLSCKYNNFCQGFPQEYFVKFDQGEVKPIKDIPAEVMIEVESRCNFNCSFCYNHNSFAEQGRGLDNLSSKNLKKIINHISKLGIKIIRFTGGEPLVRKDIFELLKYAKNKGLEVRLNTNGSLVNNSNILKMKGVVDNVLIPIESWVKKQEEEITGYKKSLELKINTIKFFKKINTPVIRVGTVATDNNIKNFSKFSDLILNLPIHEWEFYRPITGGKKCKVKSIKLIDKLVDDICRIREKTNIYVSIANSIPFCFIKEPGKLSNVSSGALFDDGYSRLVVDPRGFLKPHYFLEKNIGDPLSIKKAWNCNWMKKMRNLEFLPDECRDCRFKFKCRGGSRYEAMMASDGNIRALDPLANPKNII